jgi:hypothetical protein
VDSTPKKIEGWSVLDEGGSGSADVTVVAEEGDGVVERVRGQGADSPGRGEIRKTTRVVVRYDEMDSEIELGQYANRR